MADETESCIQIERGGRGVYGDQYPGSHCQLVQDL